MAGSQDKASIQSRPNHSFPPLPQHSIDNIKVINSDPPSGPQRDAESAMALRLRGFKADQDGSLTYNPPFVGPTTPKEDPSASFAGQQVSIWQYIKNKYKGRKISRQKQEAEYEDFICTVEVIFPVNDYDVKRFGRALFDTGNKYNFISRSFAEMYGIITESKPSKPMLELPGGHTYTSIQKIVGRFTVHDRNISRKDPKLYIAEFHVSDKIDRYEIIIGMDTIMKYKLMKFQPLDFTGFWGEPTSSVKMKESDSQLVVPVSHDRTVRLWDPATPDLGIPVETPALTQFGTEQQPLRLRSDSDLISIVDPDCDSGYGTASDVSSLPSLNIPPGTEDYLVSVLLGDAELMSSCQSALARVRPDRFESSLTTLLKICSRDLRQEAQTRAQKGASRVLKTYSAYAASCVRQHFLLDPSVRTEMMNRAAKQPVVKEQLMRLLQQPDFQATNLDDPSLEDLDDIDSDEDVEPTVLDELKDFILTSSAFWKMRRSLAEWIDPPKQSDRQSSPGKALSEGHENELSTIFQTSQTSQDQHSAPTQVAPSSAPLQYLNDEGYTPLGGVVTLYKLPGQDLRNRELNLRKLKDEGSSDDESRSFSSSSAEVVQNAQLPLFLSSIISYWVSIRSVGFRFPMEIVNVGCLALTNLITRTYSLMERGFGFAEPPICKNNVRLKWICSCGQEFYHDFPVAFSGDVVELKQILLSSGYRAAVYGAHYSHPSQGSMLSETQAGQGAPRGGNLTELVSDTLTRGEARSLGTTAILASVGSPETRVGQQDGSRPSTPIDRWLLFCLPFYEHVHKAVHIEVPLPISDQNLFKMLRKEYSDITGPIKRLFGWKKVKKISFVQFYLRLDILLNDNVAVLNTEWHPPADWKEKDYWDPCPEEKQPRLAKFAEAWLLHQWNHPHERLAFRIWSATKLSIKKVVQRSEYPMMDLPMHNPDLTSQQVGEADAQAIDLKTPVRWDKKYNFIFRIVPKRLLVKMKGDNDDPACGWGMAVELGFGLPFYLEFLALFVITSLIFGILAWCLIQLKTKGYAVFGVWSGLIGALGFCFTIIKVYAG